MLSELWRQFHVDARTSYRLYSKEIETERPQGRGRVKHFIWMARQFLWAVFDKLTPARRVLLLVALIFLIPDVDVAWNNDSHTLGASGAFWGVILLLVLLLLEISDRVVMKRDLQIAKEIQAWLLPPVPPAVPGLEIAFATRPANTVAGDYYDVFPRRPTQSPASDYLIAIADVAGKSVPAAMLMATFQASLKTLSATESPLTELVGRMNNYACSNSQNGRRFTTAFIAEYEPASRTLSYVNAGHNPPILRRRIGSHRAFAGGRHPARRSAERRLSIGSGYARSRRLARHLHRWRDGGGEHPRRRVRRTAHVSGSAHQFGGLAADAAKRHHDGSRSLCRRRVAA